MKELTYRILVAITVVTIGSPLLAAEMTADAALQQLKSLEGTWIGTPEGAGDEAEAEAEATGTVTHVIEVSAAGTVVMETMQPGTDHEMINMYHLDGEDLRLTHYCAGGNQPQMKLDLRKSSPETLVFDFVGGSNLDPAVDHHIHAAEIGFVDRDHLESIWRSWGDGRQQATMTFHLARSN